VSTASPDRSGVDEPRFRDALRSLPDRVWIVSLGILVNRVGNFLPVFIVLYLTGRGYSAGAAGLVLGVSGLGNVLGNAVGGYLADKIGRRWTIVLSAVTTAGLTAIVPSLGPFPIIVAVVGLIGVTSQIYRPAAAAVLLDSVATNQQRLAAFAVFRFGMNIGAALGGVIGGVLAPSRMVGRYQGLYGAAYTIGTGAGPLIGGAVYAIGPWALWALVGAAGLLSAQLCLPRRRAASTADRQVIPTGMPSGPVRSPGPSMGCAVCSTPSTSPPPAARPTGCDGPSGAAGTRSGPAARQPP
jgi:MFS family permease